MTEPLPWSDSFSVGDAELDAEHRRMQSLINQACLACDAKQGDGEPIVLLRDLESVTAKHFEHEEALLEELYSGLPSDRQALREMLAAAKVEHAAEHRKKQDELQDISRRVPYCDTAAARTKLCEDLTAWFVDHAIADDASLKTILQSV